MYAYIKASLRVPQICIIIVCNLQEPAGDEKALGLEEKYIITVIFPGEGKAIKKWKHSQATSILTILLSHLHNYHLNLEKEYNDGCKSLRDLHRNLMNF